MSNTELVRYAQALLAQVHGMPWVAQDVDKALADKLQGETLRRLLVLIPELVDALDDTIARKTVRRICDECEALGEES